MPNVANEKTLTGNRAILRASSTNGGRVLGVGRVGNFQRPQNVGGSINTGLQPVSELGNKNPVEHVAGMYRYAVNITQLLLQQATSGYDPRQIIENDPIQIEVVDNESGQEIEIFYDCSLATRDFRVDKHNMITGTLAFEALNASSGRS